MPVDQEQLKRDTMRRIYFIHRLRELTNPTLLKALAITVVAAATSMFVSVKNIIANMPSITEPAAVYKFSLYAFLHTTLGVQLASLLILGTFLFLIKDFTKKLIVSRHRLTLNY